MPKFQSNSLSTRPNPALRPRTTGTLDATDTAAVCKYLMDTVDPPSPALDMVRDLARLARGKPLALWHQPTMALTRFIAAVPTLAANPDAYLLGKADPSAVTAFFLKDHGVRPHNLVDGGRTSPLHEACKGGWDTREVLLEILTAMDGCSLADFARRDRDGKTPLEVACALKDEDDHSLTVQFLRSALHRATVHAAAAASRPGDGRAIDHRRPVNGLAQHVAVEASFDPMRSHRPAPYLSGDHAGAAWLVRAFGDGEPSSGLASREGGRASPAPQSLSGAVLAAQASLAAVRTVRPSPNPPPCPSAAPRARAPHP